MNVENNRIVKYTFMIIPFRYKGFENKKVLAKNVFKECDHSKIKYNRLYKHISMGIDKDNESRTIFDYWYDKTGNSFFDSVLKFRVKTETNAYYEAEGYLKDCFAYCFSSNIGFLVLHFVFDEKTKIDAMCEVLNKLKKIKRQDKNSTFEILDENTATIDLYEFIRKLPQNLDIEYDLFFQHSSDDYVSATMLSSFTYCDPTELCNDDKEEHILNALECLKRAQGQSYGAYEENKKYIRPFRNILWGFSSQGIGNINYNDPQIGNISFLERFYKNIKREYLLMTLLVLNQELILLDYCQMFSSGSDTISENGLMRLNDFKIMETFTTVSHLEHYKAFYELFSEKLGIQKLLDEVNTKQNAVYQENKKRISEEKQKKEQTANKFTKILSVILSVFGISGLINNIANLINRDNAWKLSLIVIACVVVAVVAVMIISWIFEKRFYKKMQKEQKKVTKNHLE